MHHHFHSVKRWPLVAALVEERDAFRPEEVAGATCSVNP